MAPQSSNGGDSSDDVAGVARRLTASGEPFVRATVVRREPPVSATVGDRAIVTGDGEIHGWIGGVECAQTAVAREAREAIRTGEARFVGLAPDSTDIERPGLVALPMTCHGGGTLEVFLEPVLPATELVLVGATPVAEAVERFAAELGFQLPRIDSDDPSSVPDAFDGPSLVVVASMGEMDAAGVAAAVELDARYIGLVANERRAAEVIDRAADRLGMEPGTVRSAVTVPAGVDVDARTPAEIGVSIAAELVRVRHETDATAGIPGSSDTPVTARDPVCGMAVDVASPAATVEHAGERYHFCSEGCAESFESTPEVYLADA